MRHLRGPRGERVVILPSKHLGEDRALITIGAEVLALLREPKTVSRLWTDLKQKRAAGVPVLYDWFVLSLDVLFALGLVDIDRGRVARLEKP
jgi:hypothetical protein